MTITYPYDPPSSPAIKAIRWTGFSQTGISTGNLSLAQQVQAHQGEALSAEIELPAMTRAEASAWIAWRLALRGRFGYFRMAVDPTATSAMGAVSGSPVANSNLSPVVNTSRSRLLYVRSLLTGVTDVFKAGDWISVEVDSLPRLHMNLQDVNSDGSGLATLDIWPALRGDISDGATITYSTPKGTFRLSENTAPWDVDEMQFYGVSFNIIERLP